MLDRLFQTRSDLDGLDQLLAQGRRQLWLDQLDQAGKTFVQVATKVKAHVKTARGAEPAALALLFQANLGVWAVRYLDDPRCRSELEPLLQGQNLDGETVAFLARVFQTKGDVSAEALKIYRVQLKLDRSPKSARRIRDLVAQLRFSYPALALYAELEPILTDDLALAGTLCRWYLQVGDQQNARLVALRLVEREPTHREAQRCLGVIAEQRHDWGAAVDAYRMSRDYLRLAVVAARGGRIAVARAALDVVPETERTSPTWLYYRGWVAHQQGEPAMAIASWSALCRQHPATSAALTRDLSALLQRAVEAWLDQPQYLEATLAELRTAGMDVSLAEARAGAHLLLLRGDIARGKALLQRALQGQRSNIRVVSYLALADVLESHGAISDGRVFRQLLEHYQDATLFLWLRGLTLLKEGNPLGVQYLQRAHADGICNRHLPREAWQTAAWLAQSTATAPDLPDPGETLDLSRLDHVSPAAAFLWAAIPSYTLARVCRDEQITWARLTPPADAPRSTWSTVLAAYHSCRSDWSAGLSLLDGGHAQLRRRILAQALREALRQEDWHGLAHYVRQGLESDREHGALRQLEQQIGPKLYRLLWQRGEWEQLQHELEAGMRGGDQSAVVAHALALVCTRFAVLKDQQAAESGAARAFSERSGQARDGAFLAEQAHNATWKLAIGYWAVALSNDTYWQDWCARRATVYGEAVATEQTHELVTRTIPSALRAYHEEQFHRGGPFALHHRFYAALLEPEIEVTRAMRYLLRKHAIWGSFAVPDKIGRLISPLLIKEHGYGAQACTFVGQIANLQLSPYELDLVRSAFSPVADAVALIGIEEYDLALQLLRDHLANPEHASLRAELTALLRSTLERAITRQIELEQWQDALQLADEAQQLQPGSVEFQGLAVQAAMGLATHLYSAGNMPEAVRGLERMRARLRQSDAELDNLLSELYFEWGIKAGQDEDIDTLIQRLGKALAILPSNARAREQLNVAYYQRAIKKGQAGRYRAGLEDAEMALKYGEDAETVALLARLRRAIAAELDQQKNARQSQPHWDAALEYARRQLELADSRESLELFVEIHVARVLGFYRYDDYSNAIDLAEWLLEAVPDPSLYNLDMDEFLSEMYTNYGARVYNSGDRRQGAQLMRKALQYDPNNQVARQNLSRM